MSRCGSIRILPSEDIAVMKLIAISQRGRKRDFVDLYWYCMRHEDFRDILLRVPRQYFLKQNMAHLVKSLAYFEDAEDDPMPMLFFETDWGTIKKFFRAEAARVAKAFLEIP